MGKILILVDNSNVFISGKEVYDDETVRFSYSAFERICAGEDDIIEKHLAGSVPPSSDAFWRKMENAGYHVHTYERQSAGYGRTKEKGVDMILGLRGVLAIYRLKPDRVVLLSGDCDFMPLAKLRDDMKEEGSTFTLDVWSFEDSLSSELSKVADRTFYIDDYEDKLIYFQSADGHTESFTEHADRIEKVVWEFDASAWGGMMGITSMPKFYSPLISSAQRLPNGNTLIDEGCSCRMFEVTPDKEVVWEYIAPFQTEQNYIYRAYRYPYEYVPQLPHPVETPVIPPENWKFRVPGAAEGLIANRVSVAGTWGYEGKMDACVTEDQIQDNQAEE